MHMNIPNLVTVVILWPQGLVSIQFSAGPETVTHVSFPLHHCHSRGDGNPDPLHHCHSRGGG